jgi:RHS repeat-associated protein
VCQGLPLDVWSTATMQTSSIYDCTPRFVHIANHFTGKERDTESGNDYFEARYYSSSMGRFMSPDWSAKEDPVPYATMDDPQTLNLYSYVQNNPLWKPDVDGHGPATFVWTAKVSRNSGDHQTEAKIEGGLGKVAVGIGLVGTAAVGDVPGSTAGALLVVNAVLGGVSTAVSGATDVLGAATHTDVSEGQEVLSATQNIPGLVTTAATGNLKAGDAAATLGNAASLATSPKEALKNPATMADSAQTVKDSGGLIQGAVKAVQNFFSPAPPPAPKPPPPPSYSVAGACK